MQKDDARRILLRRYFSAFGPATRQDCAAFFGWKWSETQGLWNALEPELLRTELSGSTYYHTRPLVTDAAHPSCIMLPGFDQLVLGYKNRARFLDACNAGKVTNAAGIIFPLFLLRGKLRARWKLSGKTLLVKPFERLHRSDEAAIRCTARSLPGNGIEQVEFLDEE